MISTNFRFFRPPPPPNPKKPPGTNSDHNLRPTKAMDYNELSSQEGCSQEKISPRPILKATRGRVLPNLNETNIEIRPAIGRKRKISSSSSEEDDGNLDYLDDLELGSGSKTNENVSKR